MTFQLALVAKDGWIMASDSLENRYAGAGHNAVRETVTTRKISYDHRSQTVYTVCGDQVAINCAKDIADAVRKLDQSQPIPPDWFKDELPRLVEERLSKDAKLEEQGAHRKGMFIFRQASPIWEILFERESSPKPIYDKCYNGDRNNSAKFFSEMFYRRNLAVRQLLPLAGHTIVMAGGINPSGVNGLEIIFCEDGKITDWPPDAPEIEELRASVSETYEQLKTRLTSSSTLDQKTNIVSGR